MGRRRPVGRSPLCRLLLAGFGLYERDGVPDVGVTTIVCMVKKDPVAGIGAGPGLKLSYVGRVSEIRHSWEAAHPGKHLDMRCVWS